MTNIEMKEKMVKDGWSKNIEMEEVKLNITTIEMKGQFFKMVSTGNIFDTKCKIVLYNI